MKTITIEIPEGADEDAVRYAAQRAADPDWISVWWHVSDVLAQDGDEDSDLTEEECREVLRLTDKNHDAGVGINWDTLEYWIDHVKDNREEE